MTTPPPNYTQIPNALLGDIKRGNQVEPGLMASLEGSELKVYLAVCRMTIGYHQESRRASFSMLEQLTGLSRPAVNKAAKELEKRGLIERSTDGGVTLWKAMVNLENSQEVVNSVNQEDDNYTNYGKVVVNSVNRPVNSVNQTGKLSLPPSKKETEKETNKKKKGKTTTADYSEIFQTYENEIGLLSPIIRDKILDAADSFPSDWIIRAIGRAAELNKRSWGYVAGILRNWEAIGGPQNDSPKRKNEPAQPANTIKPVYELPEPPKPPDFWSEVQQALRLQMPQATYDRCIGPTTASRENGHVRIHAPPNALDWLENRLRQTISRTVATVAGEQLQVEFEVMK